VGIPSRHWLDDRRVELGQADEERGYKEGRRISHIAGAFSDPTDLSKRLYYIAKYETTRDQYALFNEDACPQPSMKGRLPMVEVSWFDAVTYARRYSEWLLQEARGRLPSESGEPGFLRLPTEEEWEFAARGGLKVDEADFLAPLFPMPEGDLAQYAWHESTQSAEGRLRPTGLLKPNPLGLYDVLGNAAEMVFVPFYLDHRGRLHGQAGGFVTRGGDRFTPPSQIGTAVRQEHNYFDRETGGAKRMDSLGFRLVLTAPVIVSQARLLEIKQAWSVLPNLVGDVAEEAEAALKELHDVAVESKDAGLRAKLELIQRDVQQAHTRINEARGRAVRALVRMGAFLAKRVGTDQKRVEGIEKIADLAQAKLERFERQAQGRTDEARIVAKAQSQLQEKMAKWQATLDAVRVSLENTLSYYGDMVINVARDYTDQEVLGELGLVKTEFRVKQNDYLIAYAERFVDHILAYRRGLRPDKAIWLKELLAIENGSANDDETN
jgi:hypothetical protein